LHDDDFQILILAELALERAQMDLVIIDEQDAEPTDGRNRM
jgi:hypothetical protein